MKDIPSSNQPHFMLKEIYQQPEVVRECLERYLGEGQGSGSGDQGLGIRLRPERNSAEVIVGASAEGDWGLGGRREESSHEPQAFPPIQNPKPPSVRASGPSSSRGALRLPRATFGERSVEPSAAGVKNKIQNLPAFSAELQQIHILACGTSRHAALVAQYWLEQWAGIPTRVRSAAEFQEAPWPLTANTLTIAVTQSGETADTLAALRLEQTRRQSNFSEHSYWIGITNQPGSTLTQAVDYPLLTPAGQEVGVAATKTFTAQLAVFLCLALSLAQQRQSLSELRWQALVTALQQIPPSMQQVLEQSERVQALAQALVSAQHCILLGQGVNQAIALEGALKLKETTYLHAEGYAGGEFLHGPIALLDSKVPVIAIAPNSSTVGKMLTTIEKARTHGSTVIGLVTQELVDQTEALFDHRIILPAIEPDLSPLLTVIPLQLLAYHLAVLRGLDVDRPRNITKTLI